jgi:hypothetical protein
MQLARILQKYYIYISIITKLKRNSCKMNKNVLDYKSCSSNDRKTKADDLCKSSKTEADKLVMLSVFLFDISKEASRFPAVGNKNRKVFYEEKALPDFAVHLHGSWNDDNDDLRLDNRKYKIDILCQAKEKRTSNERKNDDHI